MTGQKLCLTATYAARRACLTVLLALTVACTSVVTVPPLEGMPPDAPTERIKMTARKYSYAPEVIRVPAGIRVILELESTDVVHGFKIDRYGIETEIPRRGEGTATVEFYTREPGTYGFKCSHFCGLKHPWMDGKLIVE